MLGDIVSDLPPRKFELGECVWAEVKGSTYHARVYGYEDGRNLWNAGHLGWVYHLILDTVDQRTDCVGEECLQKIDVVNI